MNKEELKRAQQTSAPVAYMPGGIARVKVRKAEKGYSEIFVEFRGNTTLPSNGIAIVPNGYLHEWTNEVEAQFSSDDDREALRQQYDSLAAEMGIQIVDFDPIAERVTLTGEEFQRLAYLLEGDPSDAAEGDDLDIES